MEISYTIINDQTGEPIEQLDATAAHLWRGAPRLLEAAQAVIDNWEQGDLAGAVRKLAAAVHSATGGA